MHSADCDKPALTRLMWLAKVGEPPDHPNHNIGYDHDVVEICEKCNGATLEALRHDCFDFEEVWDQYEWYELSPADSQKLRAIAARCEQPLNPFCNCATHKSLRESARALPRTAWGDSIFEGGAHRHVVTVSDNTKPRFSLSTEGTELLRREAGQQKAQAAETEKAGHHAHEHQAKPMDKEAVAFIVIAWPLTLAAIVYSWFRWVRSPWWLDAVVAFLAIPLSFVVSGAVLAAAKVIFGRKSDKQQPPTTTTHGH